MNRAQLLSRLPDYYAARNLKLNSPLPVNLTLTLTNSCKSRCLTCRKYEQSADNELTPEEWRRIFQHVGSIFWCTFSGGEPFLYRDLTEVYWHLINYNKPAVVNIPTNGLLSDKIAHKVWEMANMDKSVRLIINVSLDHYLPEKNDEIRGIKGYYDKALSAIRDLQKLDCENLTIGIHTVISKFNVKDTGEISHNLSGLLTNKSHYITEIAENRVELGTMNLDITPQAEDYKRAIESMSKDRSLIQSLRSVYYRRVINLLDGKKGFIPCYAGYLSGQIAADGEVWHCCMHGNSIGNLRDNGYNLKNLWNNQKSKDMRRENFKCVCPMANAGYTNSILHLPTVIKVAAGMVHT